MQTLQGGDRENRIEDGPKTCAIHRRHPLRNPAGDALKLHEKAIRIGSDDLDLTPVKWVVQIMNRYLIGTILCIVRTD